MERIQGESYLVQDGKRQFSDNPPGTKVTAAWLNLVQEEICNIIEK